MCVLYACLSGKPDLATLQANQYMNSDGNGCAWIDRGLVRWRKGIETAEELHDLIQCMDGPMLVHQRMRSAGTSHMGLTHPFPVNREASIALTGTTNRAVLAHNGTIFNWKAYMDIAQKKFGLRVRKDDPWSDTRLLAWLTARMDQEAILKMLGTGQKIAILDPQGIRITNSASWWKTPEETGGYWQSADYSGYKASKWDGYDWEGYFHAKYGMGM